MAYNYSEKTQCFQMNDNNRINFETFWKVISCSHSDVISGCLGSVIIKEHPVSVQKPLKGLQHTCKWKHNSRMFSFLCFADLNMYRSIHDFPSGVFYLTGMFLLTNKRTEPVKISYMLYEQIYIDEGEKENSFSWRINTWLNSWTELEVWLLVSW